MTSEWEAKVECYRIDHANCGIKKGDMVEVLRVADYHEDGWENSWCDRMNDSVGEVLQVEHDSEEVGFHLSDGYSYPFFVLAKVGNL